MLLINDFHLFFSRIVTRTQDSACGSEFWCSSSTAPEHFTKCHNDNDDTSLIETTAEDVLVYWSLIWWHSASCGLGEHCRISPSHFLAECRKRWLNQASFVLLCFVLFAFSGLCLVCVLSVFLICLLSCIFQRESTWMALYSLIVLMCR